MKALELFKSGLDKVLRVFTISLFVVLIALVTWQVFVRQVLESGSAWTEYLARVVFVWQGLVGAAYVIGENEDVAIDFFVRKLPGNAVKAMEVAAHTIVGFFAVWVMVWGGERLVAATWADQVQLLPISAGMVYLAVPVAGSLIAIYSILHIIETIVKPPPTIQSAEEINIEDLMEEGI